MGLNTGSNANNGMWRAYEFRVFIDRPSEELPLFLLTTPIKEALEAAGAENVWVSNSIAGREVIDMVFVLEHRLDEPHAVLAVQAFLYTVTALRSAGLHVPQEIRDEHAPSPTVGTATFTTTLPQRRPSW